MKFCPNCGSQLEDNALSCPACGAAFAQPAPIYAPDPGDHTAEFDASDISENKVMAMLPYLMGIIGVIIAMLAKTESPFTGFHVRQFLKLAVCEALIGVLSAVLCFTVIIPIGGAVCIIILLIIRIICFLQVCKGQAKEPAIVKSFSFLK